MSADLDGRLRALRWVCLDVGETLVDETRVWGTWADVLGIPRLTLFAALGAAVERGREHPNAFELVGARDWHDRVDEVEAAYGGFQQVDLYPDALRSIEALGALGLHVSVFANQPAHRRGELLALGIVPDVMEMSEALGVSKPSPRFFGRALELMGSPAPSSVAYVGDRLDNDVVPCKAAGMLAIWLRRGPWGRIVEAEPGQTPDLAVDSLDELVARLRRSAT